MNIVFGDHELFLHHAGILFWPEQKLLIASDLHLEKGSHFAQRGYFLPPYDSHDTLQRLLVVCAELKCQQVLLLGDCFHDNNGYARMGPDEQRLFQRLLDFNPIWIRGNHDADFVPQGFQIFDTYECKGIAFRHEALSGASHEISGHFHPKIDITHKGALISRRCFIEDGQRMIMPAFGAYTGGLSVSNPLISSLLLPDHNIYALGNSRIYNFKS